jgi:tetratricopeptide (TPR) repeat protein
VRRVVLLSLVLLAGCQNPQTAVQKGNIAYLSGDAGNAVLHYEKARDHSSTRAVANYNLGRLLLEQGDAERAVGYLEGAEGPLVSVFRAQAFRAVGQLDKARESLQQATPEDPDVMLEWALLEIADGNISRALELLGQLREDPVLWEEAALKASNAMAQSGDFNGAASELLRLLRVHPNRVDINHRMGRYQVQSGQYAKAEAQLLKTVRMDPSHTPSVLWLARALEGQGKLKEARDLYRKLVRGLPQDHPVAIEARKGLDASGEGSK